MLEYGPAQTLFAPADITTAFRCASNLRSASAAMDEPHQQQQQPPPLDADELPPYSPTATEQQHHHKLQQQQPHYHEQPPSPQSATAVHAQPQVDPIVVTASPIAAQTVVVLVTPSGSASPAERAAATTTVTIRVSTAPSSGASSSYATASQSSSAASSYASASQSSTHTDSDDMTNYNLDHLYCHPNEKGSPKVSLSTTPPPPPPLTSPPPQTALAATMQLQQQPPAAQQQQQQQQQQHHPRADAVDTGPDMSAAVLREIKHLKEMLMMHLDLIQEQNDQLTMRDKQMLALRTENDQLRARLAKQMAAKPPVHGDEAGDDETEQPKPLHTKSMAQLLPPPAAPPPPPPPMVAIPVASASDFSLPVSVSSIKTESVDSVPASAPVELAVPVPNEPSAFGPNNISMNVIHRCKTQLDTLTQIMTGSGARQLRVPPSQAAAMPPRPAAAIVEATATATNAGAMSLMQSKATESATTAAATAFDASATPSVAVVDRVLQPFAPDPIDAFADAEDSQGSQVGTAVPDEELSPADDASAVLDTDQKQTADKPARSQNSRRRRKRHDSIGMSRKRRRTHLQSTASKSPVPASESMPAADMAPAAAAIEQPLSTVLPPQLPPDTGVTAEARRSFITTSDRYTTRQWFIDEVAAEVDQQLAEFSIDEHAAAASAAAAAAAAATSSVTGQPFSAAASANDQPHLELPRWTVKPVIPCSDGSDTEDFSNEVFLRRHARFELDERKRKKWDIQRIREQRNVERLRRRQNRDELPEQPKGTEELGTFYPAADQVLWVQVTDELPVLAFGELVPVLRNVEFALPWKTPPATTSGATPTIAGDSLDALHHWPNCPPMPSPVQLRSTSGDGGHTTIVYAKKTKTMRRQHNQLAGAPAANAFLAGPGTGAQTGAGASTSNAVAAARANGGAGTGIGSGAKSGAKLGRGHSGLHSKRSGGGGGRKSKR